MKRTRPILHCAVIGSSSRMTDPVERILFEAEFGTQPIWLVTVSSKSLDVLCKPGQKVALAFAVCRSSAARLGVVMVLQAGTLQLRSAVGLNNPLLQDLLDYSRATGAVRFLFGTQDGLKSSVVSCPITDEDQEMLDGVSETSSEVPLERRIVELTLAAADCRHLDELPSCVKGVKVMTVDVSVVTAGEHLVGMEAGDATEGHVHTDEAVGRKDAELLH